jgi:hypothetical protein
MVLILEYSKFIAEYKPINLKVKGQPPIFFSSEKSREKELLIKSIIRDIYPKHRVDETFEFNGVMIRGELLCKAQKNIAILYEIIDIAKSKGVKIKNADDLINFIKNQSNELFHPNGAFFDRIYKKLGSKSDEGVVKESEAKEFFKRYADNKGISIDIKSPDNYNQDIDGVDAYFELNGVRYTIQIKTLSYIIEDGDFYKVYISGYFTKIKTHYLVLLPKVASNRKYIFKGRNVVTQIDESGVDYYYIPKADLLYTED